ncbi:hypothetical protein C8Q77DRAFT_405947 [Trametes polyzona]|nr:hypothetical protein C8Q77DRAFT_405947 [Trametes polyzona]
MLTCAITMRFQNHNDADASTSTTPAQLNGVDAGKIISGSVREYVVTHPGQSQYSQNGGGASACGLAALNCARLVLGFQAAGLSSECLVQQIMGLQLLEDVLKPCTTWANNSHLAVEDILKAPVFERSLSHLTSAFGQSNYGFFKRIITNISDVTKERGVSACVIITRPPEILACFSIAGVPNGSELFVTFDSHPRPGKHPEGAAFIFHNSVIGAARYLTQLLQVDQRILHETNVQWEAQLLSHCSGDIFIAPEKPLDGRQWAEAALEASLQVLSLQAQVRDLQAKTKELDTAKGSLEAEKVALEQDLIQLDDMFQREQERAERYKRKASSHSATSWQSESRTRSSWDSASQATGAAVQIDSGGSGYASWSSWVPSNVWPRLGGSSSTSGGVSTNASSSTNTGARHNTWSTFRRKPYATQKGKAREGNSEGPSNSEAKTDDPDPDAKKGNAADPSPGPDAKRDAPPPAANSDVDPVAVQLQIYYDDENQELERQLRELQAIQPEFFDCGICFEQFQEDHVARVHPCEHVYCRGCLKDYAASKIQEHRYPILCPHCIADKSRREDPGEIDDEAVQELGLSEEDYAIYVEMQMIKYSVMINCRKCHESPFVDKGEYDESKVIHCPLAGCGYAWCKLCSQEIDPSGPEHSCDGTNELEHIMKQNGWKHCPGCRTPAEKITGCNHMTALLLLVRERARCSKPPHWAVVLPD